MTLEEILAYCLQKEQSYVDYPFGAEPICIKVHGKIFAQLYINPRDQKITLKCEASMGDFYRMMYPGIAVRGYHCPPVHQPYWNTVYYHNIADQELKNMIDEAYQAVIRKLPKKIKSLYGYK